MNPQEHLDAADVDLRRIDRSGSFDPVYFKLLAIRSGLHIAAALVSHLIEKDGNND